MRAVTTLGLLAFAACSPAPSPPTDGGNSDAPVNSDAPMSLPDAPADTPAPPPDAPPDVPVTGDGGGSGTLTVSMPMVDLAPGAETTQCVEVPLDNATPQLIRRIHVTLAPGSHHLIFYRSNATTAQPTPTPCAPLAGVLGGTAPLYIAQATDTELVMPDNVGFQIGAHQMVRIEEHFVNVTTMPLRGTGTVTLTTVDPSPGIQIADLMFWGTRNINVAPHTAGMANYFHLVRPGTQVFGITAHEHHLGTLTTVGRAASATAMPMELYRNTNWAEPPLRQYSPALSFDGTDGLALHCEYNNTTDQTVRFGESAVTDEMCFFWAYYYPSHGFDAMF